MDYDLDEFLDEYDDFSQQVSSATNAVFTSRLAQWFHLLDEGDKEIGNHIRWLESRVGETVEPSDVFGSSGGNANSGQINLPSNKLDRLAAYLHLFRRFKDHPNEMVPFGFTHFYDKNINVMIGKITDAMFDPFASELRRYIRNNFDEPVPDEDWVAKDVPASDRIVTLHHNSPDYQNTVESIQSAELAVQQWNDISEEDRERIKFELDAGILLLKARTARVDAVEAVLVRALRWLAQNFAGAALGIAAEKSLSLLLPLIGIG